MSTSKHTPSQFAIGYATAGHQSSAGRATKELYECWQEMKKQRDELLKTLEMALQDIEHYGSMNVRPSSTCVNMIKTAIQKATLQPTPQCA